MLFLFLYVTIHKEKLDSLRTAPGCSTCFTVSRRNQMQTLNKSTSLTLYQLLDRQDILIY